MWVRTAVSMSGFKLRTSSRNKRSALRRIVFERRGQGEDSDGDPAGYGFAQPALRELPRAQVGDCQAGSSLGRTTTRRIS